MELLSLSRKSQGGVKPGPGTAQTVRSFVVGPEDCPSDSSHYFAASEFQFQAVRKSEKFTLFIILFVYEDGSALVIAGWLQSERIRACSEPSS